MLERGKKKKERRKEELKKAGKEEKESMEWLPQPALLFVW